MEGLPRRGEVIFLRFPYTDLSGYKNRPAIVLATLGKDDVLVCQITSQPYADPLGLPLDAEAFEKGGLPKRSYARPAKLFTTHQSVISRKVGRLQPATVSKVIDAIVKLLKEYQ